MKNQLLFVAAVGLSSFALGQHALKIDEKYIAKNNQHPEIVRNENMFDFFNASVKKLKHGPINTNSTISSVSVIDIGQGPNAFGCAFGGKTYVWADGNLNAITFSHRANFKATGDGSNGWLRYDYSKDGGMTWAVDQGPNYQANNNNAPPFANARYPQGILFNQPGNTDPDSAYFTYFAPSLASINGSGSSGGWGGHVWGSVQTSGQLASTRTEELSTRYVIPDGFTLTKQGVLYATDAAEDLANSTTPVGYKDSIYVSKGIWNSTARDFNYTTTRMYAPVSRDMKNHPDYFGNNRIAFADDGLTGYITMLGHTDYNIEPDSISHLIVYKTVDAGATWSGPILVSMDGAKPLLPKDSLSSKFTTGFEHDAVVDSKGNLHVVMPISPEVKGAFSMASGAGFWGIFDVYTTDGGTSWFAKLLGMPETLVGTFGVSATDVTNPSITEYNRCQVSRDHSGEKLFFTWFDTDTTVYSPIDQSHANMNPNAFVMGYDVKRSLWTANPLTTAGSQADGSVTFGSVSYYVFEGAGSYTVPIVYQELTGDATKTGSATQFHYVSGMTINDADFTVPNNAVPLSLAISVNEVKAKKDGVEISQNYPNPFHNSTSFNLTLAKSSAVSVDVYSALGQKVQSVESKNFAAGTHVITLEGSSLTPGIYFYTVKTGETVLTQRMIIK